MGRCSTIRPLGPRVVTDTRGDKRACASGETWTVPSPGLLHPATASISAIARIVADARTIPAALLGRGVIEVFSWLGFDLPRNARPERPRSESSGLDNSMHLPGGSTARTARICPLRQS